MDGYGRPVAGAEAQAMMQRRAFRQRQEARDRARAEAKRADAEARRRRRAALRAGLGRTAAAAPPAGGSRGAPPASPGAGPAPLRQAQAAAAEAAAAEADAERRRASERTWKERRRRQRDRARGYAVAPPEEQLRRRRQAEQARRRELARQARGAPRTGAAARKREREEREAAMNARARAKARADARLRAERRARAGGSNAPPAGAARKPVPRSKARLAPKPPGEPRRRPRRRADIDKLGRGADPAAHKAPPLRDELEELEEAVRREEKRQAASREGRRARAAAAAARRRRKAEAYYAARGLADPSHGAGAGGPTPRRGPSAAGADRNRHVGVLSTPSNFVREKGVSPALNAGAQARRARVRRARGAERRRARDPEPTGPRAAAAASGARRSGARRRRASAEPDAKEDDEGDEVGASSDLSFSAYSDGGGGDLEDSERSSSFERAVGAEAAAAAGNVDSRAAHISGSGGEAGGWSYGSSARGTQPLPPASSGGHGHRTTAQRLLRGGPAAEPRSPDPRGASPLPYVAADWSAEGAVPGLGLGRGPDTPAPSQGRLGSSGLGRIATPLHGKETRHQHLQFLQELRDDGRITQKEFNRRKLSILAKDNQIYTPFSPSAGQIRGTPTAGVLGPNGSPLPLRMKYTPGPGATRLPMTSPTPGTSSAGDLVTLSGEAVGSPETHPFSPIGWEEGVEEE
jgi:hypothetical protein